MTTSHEEYTAAAAMYAIDPGGLDLDARRAFEAHLATCDQCRTDVAQFRRVAAGVGLANEPVAPPESLRARTLAKATSQPQLGAAPRPQSRPAPRTTIPTWWLLAAASVALVATGMYAVGQHVQVRILREMIADAAAQAQLLRAELADARRDAVRLTRVVAVVSAPDLIRVNLAGQETAAAARGRAFWSKSQGLAFSADGLPALPPGRVYQLWVLAPGPVSVGVLSVSPGGTSTFSATLPANLPPINAVAVTAEPGPNGSAGPTMPILLVGKPGS